MLDYRVEDLVNVEAGFGGDADDVGGGAAEEIDDFASDFFDVGGGEVDFVDDGDNLEVLFEGEVDIGEGLGLDSIDALELIVMMEKHYGIKLKDASEGKAIFQNISTMADYIAKNRKK